MSPPKRIALLALPNVQLLDVSGPLDVFAQANVEAGAPVYDLFVVACAPGPIRSSSGARLMADLILGEPAQPFDTLLVAGAPNAPTLQFPVDMLTWLRQTAGAARRFGSVCTGAFALAAAGLLENKRITTHWAAVSAFKLAYPDIAIDADALHVRDGRVRTAAGVTAGLDLALSLVEEDLGRDIAMRVASQLVMFFKRPGGQMQFSRKGEAQPSGRAALQEIQRWVATNPALAHSVRTLAARAGLSARHFARLFQAEVGMTPAAWVESVRVQAARHLLESENDAPKQVAAKCGFANPDTLRRTFQKHVGVSPAQYRKRFASR